MEPKHKPFNSITYSAQITPPTWINTLQEEDAMKLAVKLIETIKQNSKGAK